MKFTDWYQIKENSNILIVDKNENEIEKYKDNKYDYIFLNGTLENSQEIIKSENPEVELIRFFKNILKEDGTLFIAVDNRLGVKYLAGSRSEHGDKIYGTINKQFNKGKLFSKSELDKIIELTGFKNKKFYFPLPNYENPNVIYTEELLPQKDDSKINYNFIYTEGSLIVQDEVKLLKTFIEEGQFVNFTNSYIIQLSDNEIKEEVKYYGFNNMRKEKYSLVLKMKNDYIEKYPKTEVAIEHINNINKNSKKLKELGFNIAEEDVEDNFVKSRFVKLDLLDKKIVQAIDEDKTERAYELIDNWYKYIYERLNVDENGIIKQGFIDLVFENTFFDDEKEDYIFFDQEWFKENVSIKYILYRAINNLYEHNPKIENRLLKQEILKKYDLDNEELKKQEEEFQKEIIDEEKQKLYAEQYKYIISSEEILQIIKDIKRLDKDNIELIQEIRRLEKELEKKDNMMKKQESCLNRTIIGKVKDKIFNNKG